MNPGNSLMDIELGRYSLSFGGGSYAVGFTGNVEKRSGTPKYQKRNKVRTKMAQASRRKNRR